MSSIVVAGDTSGSVTLQAPTVAGSTVLTLPAVSGTLGIALPAGTIIPFAGTTAPTGFLACPTIATSISRAVYDALFAAIGTTWGVGNGSTTFGMPFFAGDQLPVQAGIGIVGTNTVGAVIAHTHTGGAGNAAGGQYLTGGAPIASTSTGSTGGAANLAAGNRVLFCVKY